MIIRGILQTITDGAVRLISATGRIGEAFSSREFLQHYGYASSPQPGAELVIVAEGNIITVIGSDDRRYRLALAAGEVALYDDLGQSVHLTRNGIVVKAPQIILDGYVKTTNHLEVKTGVGGVFTDKTGKTISVKNGIIVGGL